MYARMRHIILNYIIYIRRYKKYRLIKGCDLQLYEGVAFSPNSKSQGIVYIKNSLTYI